MFRPLISANIAQHGAQIGALEVEADRIARVRRAAAPAGLAGCRLRRGCRSGLTAAGPPARCASRPAGRAALAGARELARPASTAERGDRIDRRRISMRAASRPALRATPAAATNGAAGATASSKSTTIGVALAADVVRDRLASVMRTRETGAPSDSAASTATRGDRAAFGARRHGSWRRSSAPTLRKSSTTVSGSGRVVDVRHRLGGLDDERRALGVHARADGLQPHRRQRPAPAADAGRARPATPASDNVRKRAKPLVTVTPWRPLAIAAVCGLPAASRATADR